MALQKNDDSYSGLQATLRGWSGSNYRRSILLIFVASVLLFAVSNWLQGSIEIFSRESLADNALDVIVTSAELLAVILSIVITVVAIIVELAANRYSHRITSLFVREPVNIVAMVFLVVSTVYCLWTAMTVDANRVDSWFENAGVYISIFLISASLIILLPYFAFVMSFLSPVNVISRIRRSALSAIGEISGNNIEHAKGRFLDAIDDLQDIARRASDVSDRAVETASIEALRVLLEKYQDERDQLAKNHPDWFLLTATIMEDPDFVSLFHTSLENIDENDLWVEVKILRQYLELIIDNKPISRDISYLIAINTRKMALMGLKNNHNLELTRLCIQCFNSYLRSTINKKDPRTCYYIMNQYRMLAESLLEAGKHALVTEMVGHFQFYGILAYKMELPFILEVAAEDIMALISSARPYEDDYIGELVGLFLSLDQEVKRDYQEDSLLGVRRAQIKLAVYFLDSKAEKLAERICQDMLHENKERLREIIAILKNEDRSEYWEFTDRGVNFTYLEPGLRKYLDAIAARLELNLPGT